MQYIVIGFFRLRKELFEEEELLFREFIELGIFFQNIYYKFRIYIFDDVDQYKYLRVFFMNYI